METLFSESLNLLKSKFPEEFKTNTYFLLISNLDFSKALKNIFAKKKKKILAYIFKEQKKTRINMTSINLQHKRGSNY